MSSTTVLLPRQTATLDGFGNIIIDAVAPSREISHGE
jgi:hypothetical protein